MPISKQSIKDREYKKFRDRKDGTAVAVLTQDLVLGEDYDRIDATYPTSTTEQYAYSNGATLVLTVEVTYLSASKKDIQSVVVL